MALLGITPLLQTMWLPRGAVPFAPKPWARNRVRSRGSGALRSLATSTAYSVSSWMSQFI